MCTAHARRLYEAARKPVRIIDRHGRDRWHEVWENSPIIARPGAGGDTVPMLNGGGARPYVQVAPERFVFRAGMLPGPGEVWFSAAEQHRIEERRQRWPRFVVIEPNTKAAASPNKDWGWGRYETLKALLPNVAFFQLGPSGTRLLPGVTHIETPTFRAALAALSLASAYVGAEGGLHHGAAALGVPAVVIFGGFIAPSVTGYVRPNGAAHVNLYTESQEYPHGCGWRRACDHCRGAMAAITPERVADELRSLLQQEPKKPPTEAAFLLP